MTLVICTGCDGKKYVNYVKLKSGQAFTDDTKTTVRRCLICKGSGKMHRNKSKKRLNRISVID